MASGYRGDFLLPGVWPRGDLGQGKYWCGVWALDKEVVGAADSGLVGWCSRDVLLAKPLLALRIGSPGRGPSLQVHEAPKCQSIKHKKKTVNVVGPMIAGWKTDTCRTWENIEHQLIVRFNDFICMQSTSPKWSQVPSLTAWRLKHRGEFSCLCPNRTRPRTSKALQSM